ncbi:MAG: hypothetical protein PVI00_12010 [Desulfobacterales bacterium]
MVKLGSNLPLRRFNLFQYHGQLKHHSPEASYMAVAVTPSMQMIADSRPPPGCETWIPKITVSILRCNENVDME